MVKRFWPALLGSWKWSWHPRQMIITGVVLTVLGVAMHLHWPDSPARKIAIAGGIVLVLGILMVAVRHLVVPADTGFAALVTVDLVLTTFTIGFPVLTIVLATSGATGSALKALGANKGASSVAAAAGIICLAVIEAAVILVPQQLRKRHLCINTVSELARTLVPSWLTAVAAVATLAYVFLLRFGDGALSGSGFGTLAVAAGGAAAAVLLVPVYQFTARSCWEHGLETVLDPQHWRQAVTDVRSELRQTAEAVPRHSL
jgi:hypothetical protein